LADVNGNASTPEFTGSRVGDDMAPLAHSGLRFVLTQFEDQSMKRGRFSEEQIIGILKEHEAGVAVVEVCRKTGPATPASTSGKPGRH
jgi:hypothetical protein